MTKSIIKVIIIFIIIILQWIRLSGVHLNPTVVEVSVIPNRLETGYYHIRNYTAVDAKILVEPESFYGSNIDEWLTLTPTSFTLGANQGREVQYGVKLPLSIKDEVCAHIYFKQIPLTEKKGGVGIITRMGSSFYASVSGHELVSPEFIHCNIYRNNSKYFMKLKIKNNGNVHLRIFYNLSIYNEQKNVVFKKENTQLAVIIPGAKKDINIPVSFKDKPDPGKYSAELMLIYGNIAPWSYNKKLSVQFEVPVIKK